jgi:arylsulfatase A-like enzyme
MLAACPSSPFQRWPLGRGFERYYGFLGGETNRWYLDLTLDNEPTVQPEDGYHLSEDLPVDRSFAHTRGDSAAADVETADALRLLPERLRAPVVIRDAAGLEPRVLDRGRRRHPRRLRGGRARGARR